ncbi:MAG: hypothetical protein N2645_06835 [Clostridia bacterium]|nr:hypothetical protein [Clostridia bacterium]
MDCPTCSTEMIRENPVYKVLICPLCGYEEFIEIPEEFYEDINKFQNK